MSKQYLNPDNLPNWQEAFSQIVVCTNPRATIYISGQVSADENRKIVGPGDLPVQAMKAFDNLHLALKAAGASEKDVVKLTIYIKNYLPADAEAVGSAVRAYYSQGSMPASSWVGVQSLADENFLIEVDAVAVL